MTLELLPREVLFRILDDLPISDVKSVSSVSRYFYDLTNDPFLWKKFHLSARCPKNLKNALSLHRLEKIESLDLYYFNTSTMWNSDFCEIFKQLKEREFESLGIVDCDLTYIHPTTLAKVFQQTRALCLGQQNKLCVHQTQAIFRMMSSSPRLSQLHIEKLDLRHLHPQTFACGVTSLQKLTSYHCMFTVDQLAALFHHSAHHHQSSRLFDLSLFIHQDMSTIPNAEFAETVSRMHSFLLTHCLLTHEQIIETFIRISKSDSTLQSLHILRLPFLGATFLQDISPEVIGEAISKLHEVVLPFFIFNKEQMEQILLKTAQKGVTRRIYLNQLVEVPDNIPDTVLNQLCAQLDDRECSFKIKKRY